MDDIRQHISNLRALINKRLSAYFSPENNQGPEMAMTNLYPAFSDGGFDLNYAEYYLLVLALAPHIQPGILDSAVQEFLPNGGDFPEFGGVKSGNHRVLLFLVETALFLLAGNDID